MKIQKINIELQGLKPIIFNLFNGTEDKVPTEKKVPIIDGKLAIRGDRLLAFFIDNKSDNPPGCIKSFVDTKKYKMLLPKVKAYIGFPTNIPILVNKKEITWKGFEKTSEVKVRTDQVRGGGLMMNAERPYIEDWSLNFTINLVENKEITPERLKDWFERGGIEVGLGASRPVYGQFIVIKFDLVD